MAKIDQLDHGRVLDIGASFQTQLMRAAYPGSVIDTLGYTDPRFAGRESDTHIQYDLNYAPHTETWLPAAAPYECPAADGGVCGSVKQYSPSTMLAIPETYRGAAVASA